MSFASDLLATITSIRAIPGQYGLRPHTVALVEVLNSGNHPGAAPNIALDLAITEGDGQSPKVRWLKDEEIAVGALPAGTVEVGPITPLHATGGTDLSRLDGRDLQTNDQLYLRITGPMHPNGALYLIKSRKADRALRYMIRAVPTALS
jgi:hypothetical protein